ncbi:Gag-Pol protein [Plakobranchus ocellatus]|uniref:Gag-Pol protein n=1 Tax=Plakobranchus ocellatus TaxID=259542 RepID=A0AAV4C3L7_9GAST|nr:Gag-Pol protein [Plakobranchus ocellatus]
MKAKLKTELGDMSKRGIITSVEDPTPWVSQLVVTPKPNGKIRICLDPKYLNKALQREHYTMPILDDILHDLSSSKVFTKADLQNGYWHVQLDEESSRLTTFQICFGRFRFLRLPFGLNVSAEIFERKIRELFGDMPGVVCMRDDIIIHGKNQQEHDENLQEFMNKCSQFNIKLNKEKFELSKDQISFMGHIFSRNGISTDPKQVEAIVRMPSRTRKKLGASWE